MLIAESVTTAEAPLCATSDQLTHCPRPDEQESYRSVKGPFVGCPGGLVGALFRPVSSSLPGGWLMRFLRRTVAAAILTIAAAVPAYGQAVGQIFGKVTDNTGAVMPGVTVT